MQDARMPFKPLDRMETERLLLRPLAPEDCQALFEQMLGDPETMQDLALQRHADAWMTHDYITESMLGWRFGTRFRYGLFGKDDGALSAIIELTPRLPQIELGVVISRSGGNRRRRDGIVALRQLLAWLIAQPGIYRVFACCAVDGRAYSAMERLGFTREGVMVNYEARPNRGLVAADSYLYAMTRSVASPASIDEAAACEAHA
ncbi:GNAT family N-acetyltransferase [Paraburkholderia sp. B3]|uniref:GNAT family N-acetyltransferase n=1 Tax=Paraburkholderia sp. B3 TaxID=3134791 RepID=UPI003981A545